MVVNRNFILTLFIFPPKRHVCDPATFLSTWEFCSIMFYFSKETWSQRAPW